jgi:cyclic-di-GMP-binding biofilm dispersal mediator protein
MSRSLSGAVVAVVGASGGLGAPIARRLADRGAHVLLAGPHAERLNDLGIEGSSAIELDLRDPRAGDVLAAVALDRHGRLDGLVNAAGVVAFGPLVETDDTVIEELFLTNVIGPLWLMKRVVPPLAESRGFVVNLSAVVAEQPMANMAAYSATKAALTGADRSLTRELRRLGIQMCDVRPPHTETGLAQRPLAGSAPALPAGLSPDHVAACVIDAIEGGATELPSRSFTLDATSPGPQAPGPS